MVKKSKGLRRKTRKILKKNARYRTPITKFLQEFSINERVLIKLEPSSQKGMPHKRFHGKIGRIIGRRGKSYIVEILDGNKRKSIISRPEHLRRIE